MHKRPCWCRTCRHRRWLTRLQRSPRPLSTLEVSCSQVCMQGSSEGKPSSPVGKHATQARPQAAWKPARKEVETPEPNAEAQPTTDPASLSPRRANPPKGEGGTGTTTPSQPTSTTKRGTLGTRRDSEAHCTLSSPRCLSKRWSMNASSICFRNSRPADRCLKTCEVSQPARARESRRRGPRPSRLPKPRKQSSRLSPFFVKMCRK